MTETLQTDGELDTRQLLGALRAVKRGDFGIRLPLEHTGTAGEIAESFNDVAQLLETSTDELARLARVVGKEGQISQRATLPPVSGGWTRRVEFVNSLLGDL